MAKIRNVSGQALVVPWLGHVQVADSEVIEVPDEALEAYINQPGTWREVGTRKPTTDKES